MKSYKIVFLEKKIFRIFRLYRIYIKYRYVCI